MRDDEFKDEIDKEKHDPFYFPTYNDVIDLFTAATVNELKAVTAYGGGI